jgi:hypothetical protein
MEQKKESYVQPMMVKHELLRDITAGQSGYNCDDDRKKHGWWRNND